MVVFVCMNEKEREIIRKLQHSCDEKHSRENAIKSSSAKEALRAPHEVEDIFFLNL